ncbi:MAG: hypothetical protein NW205_04590 [Hyphomicrobiaceae bacterium]|nr:hypothetical protein [Hyphomicrobiaceae bacterium]
MSVDPASINSVQACPFEPCCVASDAGWRALIALVAIVVVATTLVAAAGPDPHDATRSAWQVPHRATSAVAPVGARLAAAGRAGDRGLIALRTTRFDGGAAERPYFSERVPTR